MVVEMYTGAPLFPGDSDVDQLWLILKCLGGLAPQHLATLQTNSAFKVWVGEPWLGLDFIVCTGLQPTMPKRISSTELTSLLLATDVHGQLTCIPQGHPATCQGTLPLAACPYQAAAERCPCRVCGYRVRMRWSRLKCVIHISILRSSNSSRCTLKTLPPLAMPTTHLFEASKGHRLQNVFFVVGIAVWPVRM